MFQGISLKKRVRERKKERKKDMGRPSFFGELDPLLYFQRGLLYPELYTQLGEKCRVNSTFHQY